MARLAKVNADCDRRKVRQALSDAEFSAPLAAAGRSTRTVGGLDGPTRQVLYLTAALTGLLARALAGLTVGDCDLNAVTIRVVAALQLNREGRFSISTRCGFQFGTSLARVGLPLATAQKLMGHSTPVLTAKSYTKLDADDLGEAVAGMSVLNADRDTTTNLNRLAVFTGPC